MWKVLRTLWVFRCAVMFKGEKVHIIPFMSSLLEALQWWMKTEVLAVPNEAVSSVLKGVHAWLNQSNSPPISFTLCPAGPLVQWKKRKANRQGPVQESHPSPGGEFGPERWVFTDGSFAWEGPGVGFAGCGFYVEGNPPISKAFSLPGVQQTNNRAEMYAVIRAVQELPQEWRLFLMVDSMYVVQGVSSRFPNMGRSGPLHPRAVGRLVANADLWGELTAALVARQNKWSIMWLRGHVGVLGNEMADRLANQGRLLHPARLAWLRRISTPEQWFEWEP